LQTLTEFSTFTPTVVAPQDGIDFRTAASLLPALQALANRTRLLLNILQNGEPAIEVETLRAEP
jgi:hypothetical protein